jgi:outer membrane lipoprotein carrier protein
MKRTIILSLLSVSLWADIGNIFSFEADFDQKITDDQNKTIEYKGHVIATKPQFAVWRYTSPIKKEVYIASYKLIMIEPDLEQVIMKRIDSKFDIFALIKNAKKVKEDEYLAHYRDTTFLIKLQNDKISEISYRDEFDNKVIIDFSHQKQNQKVDMKNFIPVIPDDYDIIRG